MRRFFIYCIAMLFVIGSFFPGLNSSIIIAHGLQDSNNIMVTLPDFKVTMNEEVVNNDYSKYPLIVYKDITYFPMTYSDCRYLGVESIWKGNKEGLEIEKTGVTCAYNPYKASGRNKKNYRAKIASFAIKVNGNLIDNSKQPYPLLSFRDITYFPMTWKFGVDEFGWDYSFDDENGLEIKSNNPKITQITISSDRPKIGGDGDYAGNFNSGVAIAEGYVYYRGYKGVIMQAPLTNTTKSKKVFQLDLYDYDKEIVYEYRMYNKNGKVEIQQHSGGNLMGSDCTTGLNSDGTTTVINNNRTKKKIFGEKTFEWWVGPMPGANNLTMEIGNKEPQPIGNPDYIYGWQWSVHSDGGEGGTGDDTAYLVGDNLYILGFFMGSENPTKETTGIYKVNINTGKTTRLVDSFVKIFRLEGDYIYYTNGVDICKIALSTGKNEVIKTITASPYDSVVEFEVLNGNIYCQVEVRTYIESEQFFQEPQYYICKVNSEDYLYDSDRIMLGNEKPMEVLGTTDKYLVCTFEEKQSAPYRIVVFDKHGKIVFKTSDKAYIGNISIEKDHIYFYGINTGTVCSAVLK